MTDTSAKSDARGRFRLRTFGTPGLFGDEGDTLLGKHGHQHRRLALLAVLAAADRGGRSRDQLLLLFWPDATQARARHSLEQLLYAIRNSIGEDVFAGVNPVRLNTDVIGSDVGDFQRAIDSGDLERAVKEYRGPFLDGFYLTDAPEFDQWLSAERAQLERAYSGALEKLAVAAETAGDSNGAIQWWQKLAETDPVSSRNASGLIRSLMNAGDYAGALQYAERYESVVADQLGTHVGPAVAALVSEVRSRSESGPASLRSLRSLPQRSRPLLESTPAVAIPDDPPEKRSSATPRTAVSAALIILLLASGGLWIWRNRDQSNAARAQSMPSSVSVARYLAVRPLVNLGGDQQDKALVDGLSEEMIAVLAKIPNLRVMSPVSAAAFKADRGNAAAVAESLGVTNILEGSVQKSGSSLRVHVRLLDARTGSTVWSETYDRQLEDIFAVQSDIAGAVARELDLRFGANTLARIRHGSTQNLAAYELFLRGSDPARTRSDSAASSGIEYFRQAIALDSNYAAAYAGFARMTLRSAIRGDKEIPLRDRIATAEKALHRAIAIDDSLAEAHAIMSIVHKFNYDMASAETEIKKAIALDPSNARFREFLVQLYVMTGRPREALMQGRRAVELDPLSPTATAELAHALMANGRCDEALRELDKLKPLRPPVLRAVVISAQCHASRRMWNDAVAVLRSVLPGAGARVQAQLGFMLARGGQTAEARRILASLRERERRIGEGAFDIALVHAGLGENNEAFAWLDKAVDDHSLAFDWISVIVTDLRADPRMQSLERRIGTK